MTKFRSLQEFANYITERNNKIIPAVKDAVEQQGDDLVEQAKANAPVATGRLRDSIRRSAAVVQNEKVSVDVSADTPYAFAVHERSPQEDRAHQGEATPEGIPGRKYLTRPLHAHHEDFKQRIRTAVMKTVFEENE